MNAPHASIARARLRNPEYCRCTASAFTLVDSTWDLRCTRCTEHENDVAETDEVGIAKD